MVSLQRLYLYVGVAGMLVCGFTRLCTAESFTTNVINAVSTNAGASYVVGDTGAFNDLEIRNGGSLTNQVGIIGNATSASNNAALITGANSVWWNTGTLTVGAGGSFNQLTVSNSASVVTTNLLISTGTGAVGNVLTLAGGSVSAPSVDVAAGTNSAGAIWVTGGALGVPNGGVTIGDLGSGQMTVSNGTVQANTIVVGSQARSRGVMAVAGGTNSLVSYLLVGVSGGATGSVWLTSGQIAGDVAFQTYIGYQGVGDMTISNGLLQSWGIAVGINQGSSGTFTMAGGNVNLTVFNFEVGVAIDSKGSTWINGGQLDASVRDIEIGESGSGSLVISNGTVRSRDVLLGDAGDGDGRLTVAGGTLTINRDLQVACSTSGTGTVWVTGGLITVTNGAVQLGGIPDLFQDGAGIAKLNVSNGTMIVRDLLVATNLFGRGTLTMSGGTVTVQSRLVVGLNSCGTTGLVTVSGGQLFVTNATHTAFIDVSSGTFTVNGGTVIADRLVVTNACGRFIHAGGIVSATTTNLDPSLDADGDGLPNGWEQTYRLDPFDPTGNNGASGDPDGDGYTNLQEFLGGTDPTNSASFPVFDDSWTNSASGFWQVGSNWSLGVPPSTNNAVYIINPGSKIVTIDATTTNTPASMVISNLIVSSPSGATNTLSLASAGTSTPLRVNSRLQLGSGGELRVLDSALQAGGILDDGNAWIGGSQASVVATNFPTALGVSGAGQMTISNGTVRFRDIILGSNTFTTGTMTIAGGNLVVSNLVVASASNTVGTVWITGGNVSVTKSNQSTNVGRFGAGQIIQSNGTCVVPIMFIGTGIGGAGTLTVAGGTMQWVGSPVLSSGSNAVGAIWLTGGQILGGVSPTIFRNGFITVSNGLMRLRDLSLASLAGSVGTLTIAGGTVSMDSAVSSNFYVASGLNSTGAIWVTGGQLLATNNNTSLYLGLEGAGRMAVSNGTVQLGTAYVGVYGPGVLTLTGGSLSLQRNLYVGFVSNSSAWVTGGQLSVTNGAVNIATFAPGQMTVSGGVVVAREMCLSSNFVTTVGSLTVPGGQVTVFDRLVVGDCASNTPGSILVNGGQLFVTNATQTGFLDMRAGTLTFSAGTLAIDRLIMTNACGHFVHTGGALSITATNLDPNSSAVGDGIPNWWKQQYDLDPFDPNVANRDSDADGLNNLQEYLAGTNPTNSSSALRITAITPVGADMRVYFTSVGGKYYSLERSDVVGGAWTGIVTNIPGNDDIQWAKDIGGAVRTGAFYRVRLGQPTSPPPADSDGDGIIDGWEQKYFGHPTGQTNDASCATCDADGDGLNNLQEFLVGTEPTNSASSFRIISIAPNGNDLFVTWTMGSGKTNALQSTGGNYATNSFANIFTVTNTLGNVTNYLDVGGATNVPSRFYRIRLVP